MSSPSLGLLKTLITEVVSSMSAPNNGDMDEAAVSSSEAISQRLGLVIDQKGRQVEIVLFDPQRITQGLATLPREPDPKDDKLSWGYDYWSDDAWDKVREGVVGVITISPPREGWCDKDTLNIDSVAAQPGYGPFMYDVAMSVIYPRFLTADRDSVTKSALAIWNYYLTSRSDVGKVLMKSVLKGECPIPHVSSPSVKRINSLQQQLETKERHLDNIKHLGRRPQSQRPPYWNDAKIKGDLEKIEGAIEKINTELQKLYTTFPMAWKFRIKKPLGVKRLMANADKFLQQGNLLIPPAAKRAFKLTRKTILGAGEGYFQEKYRGNG